MMKPCLIHLPVISLVAQGYLVWMTPVSLIGGFVVAGIESALLKRGVSRECANAFLSLPFAGFPRHKAFSFLPFAALPWQQLFFSLPFAAFPRCWIASFPLPFVKADEERCCDLAELKIRKW